MYPRLCINLDKIERNAKALCNICGGRGISVAAVTKVFCADPTIVNRLCRQPVSYLADTRLANIARYPETQLPRMLLRSPSPDSCGDAVCGSDISLHSEIDVLREMSVWAERHKKVHGIVIMVDMGDLREGLYHTERQAIFNCAEFAASRQWLSLHGIGVNLTCYGGVIPDSDIMGRFADLAEDLQKSLAMRFRIVSGGNSSSLDLVMKAAMPSGINNLRLGESIIRAEETAYQKPLPGLEPDAVILEAALVEVQEKPSFPEGSIGLNAFGEKPCFKDTGKRRRGILAVGRQDTDPGGLACLDSGVNVVGASSDHMIVDLTQSDTRYRVGDILGFSMNYSAILRGFTSPYVERHYTSTEVCEQPYYKKDTP